MSFEFNEKSITPVPDSGGGGGGGDTPTSTALDPLEMAKGNFVHMDIKDMYQYPSHNAHYLNNFYYWPASDGIVPNLASNDDFVFEIDRGGKIGTWSPTVWSTPGGAMRYKMYDGGIKEVITENQVRFLTGAFLLNQQPNDDGLNCLVGGNRNPNARVFGFYCWADGHVSVIGSMIKEYRLDSPAGMFEFGKTNYLAFCIGEESIRFWVNPEDGTPAQEIALPETSSIKRLDYEFVLGMLCYPTSDTSSTTSWQNANITPCDFYSADLWSCEKSNDFIKNHYLYLKERYDYAWQT